MLAETYVRLEGAIPVIGVGGIDSGDAAVAKIRAGATLVQLYSGLVFHGLALLTEIKRGLLAALEEEGHERLARSGRRRRRRHHRAAVAGVGINAPSGR